MIEFIIPQPGRKCNPGRNSSALGTAALSAREPGLGAREPGMGAEKPKSGHCAYKSGALF